MDTLEIITLPVGSLQANCYLVVNPLTNQTVIIDPGDDAEYIKTAIQTKQLKPSAIIATHGHFDHIMAAMELRLVFEIPFYLHREDQFLVKRLRQTAQHYAGFDPGPPPPIDQFLVENTEFPFADTAFDLIHTPGHTPGSLSLHLPTISAVFVGDVVFAQGAIGRTDFAYSDCSQLEQSIKRLCSLPENTLVYPGHGPPTSIAEVLMFRQLFQ